MRSFTSFFKKVKYASIDQSSRLTKSEQAENKKKSTPMIPNGLWTKCEGCYEVVYTKDIEENIYTCPICNHHFRIGVRKRLSIIVDQGTFDEYDFEMRSVNPLDYPDYEIKLSQAAEKSNEKEAVITGEGEINGNKSVIAIMDPNFIMGSLGSVVGEKITRAIEKAIENKLPLIIFTTSGGARMQEGIYSLMQMAKTSSALARLSEQGLPYISVLVDPTTGGVSASYAMLGDIILAEPGALVGFAGPRVIEQTIKQKLPEGFQTAEFLLEKGFVDNIVERHKMKDVLAYLLQIHSKEE